MTDPRYVELLKRTVNEQDQELTELRTQLHAANNRIHELEQRDVFINRATIDIPVLPTLIATAEDKL